MIKDAQETFDEFAECFMVKQQWVVESYLEPHNGEVWIVAGAGSREFEKQLPQSFGGLKVITHITTPAISATAA